MSISKAGNAHSGDAGNALEKAELSDGVVIFRADFREALSQIGKVDAMREPSTIRVRVNEVTCKRCRKSDLARKLRIEAILGNPLS